MDEKDRQWITLTVQAISKVFQDIVAERTVKNTTTSMQTNLDKFSVKRIAIVQEVVSNLWQVPAVQVWSNLLFKFEGFTDIDYLQKIHRGACFLELLSGQRSTVYDPKPCG